MLIPRLKKTQDILNWKYANEALYEKKEYSIVHRIILKTGIVRYVHEQAEVKFNKSGKPIRMKLYVDQIINEIKANKGLDLSGYKYESLERRIKTRILKLHFKSPEPYLNFLKSHPEEFDNLINTISVEQILIKMLF